MAADPCPNRVPDPNPSPLLTLNLTLALSLPEQGP